MTPPPQSRHLAALLDELAARTPTAIACIDIAGTTSFAALAIRARRIGNALRERGVRAGDRVGLLMSNRREWLESLFGALAAGATVVPFSTWSTEAELAYLLDDAAPRFVIAEARIGEVDYAAMLRRLCGAERVCDLALLGVPHSTYDFEALVAAGADYPTTPTTPIDPAVILYTSGSSSHPKAVPLDHRGIIENGFNIGEREGLTAADRVFLPAPLFWAYGAVNALPAAFGHGAALVLQPRFEPGAALAMIERYRCTALYTLPTLTEALLGHADFTPARVVSLRTGLTIGTPTDFLRAVERLGIPELCNIYGASEVYGNCCVTHHDWTLDRRAHCQGLPLPGVAIRIVEAESGLPVSDGTSGMIEVKGYVMAGYAGNSADANAEAFTADGFFRTGDAGHLQPDGSLVFDGRLTEMIKRAGINVSPAEVEEALMRHADVEVACVTGAADAERGERIVAFIVPRRPELFDREGLRDHCRNLLSRYKIPDRIEPLDALPLTATGKVARRVLRGLAEQQT